MAFLLIVFGVLVSFLYPGQQLGTVLGADQTSQPVLPVQGDSEDYALQAPGQPIPSNLTQSWIDLIRNISSEPTNWANKFDWQTFELRFNFGLSGDGCIPTRQFSSLLNFTTMDSVISVLYSKGYKVVLMDYDFCMFGSSLWVQDWLRVAEHYKGDSRILGFALFNEPTSRTWSYNVTTITYNSNHSVESAYSNATRAIHTVDQQRYVFWNIGYLQWQLYGPFEQPRVIFDFHIYCNSTAPANASLSYIRDVIGFDKKYSVQSNSLELDVTGSAGNNTAQSIWDIETLDNNTLGWFSIAYSLYQGYWIPVFEEVQQISETTTANTTSSSESQTTSSSSSSSSLSSSSALSSNSMSQSQSTTEDTGSSQSIPNSSGSVPAYSSSLSQVVQPSRNARASNTASSFVQGSDIQSNPAFTNTRKQLSAITYASSTSLIIFGLGSVVVLPRTRKRN